MTNQKADITLIILTFNEEIHIRRVIESASAIVKRIIIVDSFSKDQTTSIAASLGADIFQNPFVNQAHQLQWAMENCNITTAWTIRLDADEYLTSGLANEIVNKLPGLESTITGINLTRQVHFMGKWIKHGGYYPIHLLRIWRTGSAVIEQRWMDEHIYLKSGKSIHFQHDFVDDNLNNLSWWTSKHNEYSTREAIDILRQTDSSLNDLRKQEEISSTKQAGTKRWYKTNLYLRLPMFLRCFLYFQYRFWIRLGILDGRRGLVWHFLQGFWYRFLVDAKIYQIKYRAKTENKTVREIIEQRFGMNLVNAIKKQEA